MSDEAAQLRTANKIIAATAVLLVGGLLVVSEWRITAEGQRGWNAGYRAAMSDDVKEWMNDEHLCEKARAVTRSPRCPAGGGGIGSVLRPGFEGAAR